MEPGYKKKENRVFNKRQIIWIYLWGWLIVVGSVMSFGVIGTLTFQFDKDTALSMIWMIIPMSIVMFFSIHFLISHIEKHLGPLLRGIDRVAEGDLTVKLDTRHADEYTNVYTEFNHMVEELDRTKAEMQNFVNEFTHEFKTPITSISGFAELLYEAGDDLDKEERAEYLQIIADQSRRLSKLSQNSLLLSKVEAVRIITDKEKYSISEQIQKCGILLLKQMEEKKITLELPEDADIQYFGNAELMEHIWINLLGNALKFTPEGGRIIVTEEESSSEIHISIQDTGEGMSEETIAHIFDKYYQHDTTSLVKGNGIGLAIVHRIVELCHGRIEVRSIIGEGSTFTVILPK